METLEQFRKDKIAEIEASAIAESVYPRIKFFEYVKDILSDSGQVSDLIECSYVREARDNKYKSMRVDGYNIEPSDGTLTLYINDYNGDDLETIVWERIKKLTDQLLNFFSNTCKHFFTDNDIEKSSIIYGAAIDILQKIKSIGRIHLFIGSTNLLSERVKMRDLEPVYYGDRKIDVDLTIIDISYLYKFEMSLRPKEVIELNVTDYVKEGIPCLKAEIGVDKYSAYLAIVPGTFLCDIYRKYGGQLLESNVRSFLNVKGTVNKGIRNTILYEKEKFFTYNNGIACTADEITLSNDGSHITGIKNFQIINGGQTTASLASAVIKDNAYENLKSIYVAMKLTILSEPDEELVADISKYANSQNKVSASDLRSNKKFYIRMEQFSRKIYAPRTATISYQTRWFFERTRGQYDRDQMDMTQSAKDAFKRVNPKSQVIKKPDMAKFYNAYIMRPYDVAWGAEINASKFQEIIDGLWEKDDTQFNEQFYKDLVSMGIIFIRTRLLTSQTEWYKANSGILAQVTPYIVSKIVYEVSKLEDKTIDLKKIWNNQCLSDAFENEILRAGEFVFKIISDPHRQMINIAEWCKREACWDSVKDKPYELSNEFVAGLVSKKDLKEEEIAAKKEQKAVNAISFAIEIFNLGEKYWDNIIYQATRDGLVGPRDMEFLTLAKNSCRTMRIVSDAQGNAIRKILERLEQAGVDIKKRD